MSTLITLPAFSALSTRSSSRVSSAWSVPISNSSVGPAAMLDIRRHVFEQHDAGRVAAARVADFDLHVLLFADHHFAWRGHADRQLRHRAVGLHRGLGRVGDRGHAADVAFGFWHELHFDRAVFAGRKLAELPGKVAAFGRGVGDVLTSCVPCGISS